LINGQRGNRPSEFTLKIETPDATNCNFCRGHEEHTPPAIEQDQSPDWNWRLFPNRFPAVLSDPKPLVEYEYTHAANGRHEVLVESAEHNAQAADYSVEKWVEIFLLWQRRLRVHYQDSRIKYVHIFRNQGYRGGATLVHPHQQIVALPLIPDALQQRLDIASNEKCVHCNWIAQEIANGSRVLADSEHLLSVAAFAPRFPYEWQIISKLHGRFEDENEPVLHELAGTLKRGLSALRDACGNPDFNLILFSPPPTHNRGYWAVDILPRISTQAGFEWGTGVHIVSTPPEEAAKKLRSFL
jgi:UDPglucose--hexose-1-phosphate uridylyltransferase